ncbi:Golgi integral membrane protein 4 isoform X2 [Periplaneta americana]|uniref:Golgi integral membrane protein 4 isoform X2 n=1 Tax=Periplaneta americana TaxID=6978 RepID=UPI0037E73E7D
MSGSRLVRGTRSRLFLYVGVVIVVGLAVYIFHGAQLQLDDARKTADKCQQQQESLSAQLQVIFEYKLRLEKSLQQEKAEHRQTREDLESQANKEKQLCEKDKLESFNKYSALQQQFKLLQSQHEDLTEECNKVRMKQLQGLEERSKLESQVQAVQAELAQVQAGHTKALNAVKSEYLKLEVETGRLQKQNSELLKGSSQTSERINYLEKQNFQLQRELTDTKKELGSYKRSPPSHGENLSDVKNAREDDTLKSPVKESNKAVPSQSSPSSSSSPAAAAAPDAGINPDIQMNVLQEPLVNQDNADIKRGSQRSTTPQINPEALLSQDRVQQANNVAPVPPPGQEKHEDAKEQVQHEVPNLPRPVVVDSLNNWRHANVPAGVVPAPNVYGYHHNIQENSVNKHEENNAAGGWGWPKFRHVVQPIQRAHIRDNNPLDDNGPEEEEEDEDPAHPHRSAHGEQQEIPRQLHNPYQYNGADYDKEGPRGDLQLEEGEEEEDDDVDQIDYGNEAGGEGARHNKVAGGVANKPPHANISNKKQHDGVMVNPK